MKTRTLLLSLTALLGLSFGMQQMDNSLNENPSQHLHTSFLTLSLNPMMIEVGALSH